MRRVVAWLGTPTETLGMSSWISFIWKMHGKSLLTYPIVQILVIILRKIPKYGFGLTCWGYDPISMKQTSTHKQTRAATTTKTKQRQLRPRQRRPRRPRQRQQIKET